MILITKIAVAKYNISLLIGALISAILIAYHSITGTLPPQRFWITLNFVAILVCRSVSQKSVSNPLTVLFSLVLFDFSLLFLDLLKFSSVYYSYFASNSLESYGFNIGRHIGLLGNPNISASFYAFGILYLLQRQIKYKMFTVLFIAMCLIMVAVTFSRTVASALFICLMTQLIIDVFTKNFGVRFWILAGIIILGVCALFYYDLARYIDRFLSIFDPNNTSLAQRAFKFQDFLSQVSVFTIVFGGIQLTVYDNDYMLLIGHFGIFVALLYTILFLSLYKSNVLRLYFIILGFFTPVMVFPVFIYLSIYLED
ncbi:hypothetical protein OAH73_00510 [Planktomarina sp.]|nr:hypothetical protein [Planktomarina sp.]MDB4841055.1 hypothetical protein [Planktomarina sp.]